MDEIKPGTESDDIAPQDAGLGAPPQAAANPAPPRRLLKRPKPKSNTFSVWLALPVVFLLGLGSGWLLWGQTPAATTPDTQVTLQDNVKRYDVPTGNNPSQGPENAPVTIVEFSDYQCPYCVRWYQEVYTRLMKDYAGKVRFVYRDFPLYSIHPEAQPAAEAANCAGEQNAYWQYHDALFGQKDGLGAAAFTQYASELGLNMDQFNKCVSEHRYKSEVDADFKFATSLGVSSTPTFFVNGLAVVGAQPFEVFQQIIDKELAGEIPK
jgi:protein-disulfide isomerase